jgi:predicted cobalt transporter CbtA
MVRAFLVRGMLVGIVAGLLSFAFLKIYGEPQVDRAVAFEAQQDEARAATQKAESHSHTSASHDHASEANAHTAGHDEPELVSRSAQAGLGLFVAVLVYSAAFGGLFGLAVAFAYGRTSGTLTPQFLSAVMAAAGFVAIYLVPNLKYPANPPAVGRPETIGMRTALYFIMIALSLTAMIGANSFKRLCIPLLGEWNANLMMAAFYIVIVTLAGLLLPAVNEVPDGFPAIVLWEFRMASFGAQLIMWATLGLLFGALTQRPPAVGKPST